MSGDTVELNLRSITNSLRDFATLAEKGIPVHDLLRSLADRIEEMSAEQEAEGNER